ncbi:MAG: hypothetical protein JWM53_392 [bacterium]|nr:hypothetical protein [bacterium]
MRNTMLAVVAVIFGFVNAASAESHSQIHKKSYVQTKNEQVFASFLAFTSAHGVEQEQNRLQSARERDGLLLPGGAPSVQSGLMGAMMMGAAVVVAAHMPDRVRVVVDGVVHFGPAMFEGGGMGAGVGGRF